MRPDWTGERCLPWIDDVQVVYEHLHRYFFAADLVKGKRVLDLGSGEGYGSAILAEAGAASVLGIDIDAASVAYAQTAYTLGNLAFRVGAAPRFPDLPAGAFDIVVCFEVIEHLEAQEETVEEIRRLLAPGGLVLMSTPDREIYSEAHDYSNPYHVKEMNRDEFVALLKGRFAEVALWGQNVSAGSFLNPLLHPDQSSTTRDFNVLDTDGAWTLRRDFRPTYLLAVAGDSDADFPAPFSHLVDPDLHIVRHRPAAIEGEVPGTAPEDVDLEYRLRVERAIAASQQVDLDRMRQEESRLRFVAAHHAEEAGRYHHEYDLVVGTQGWKLLVLLRRVLGKLRRRQASSLPSADASPRPVRPTVAVPPWDGRDFVIEPTSNPLVSIVIPVHNHLDHTARCLDSVKANTAHALIQIVVVDDASTDSTPNFLSRSQGLTLVRNEANLGFTGAVNAGIEASSGEFVVLLNNDTEVRPGWLTALLEAMSSGSDVGAVGAKLVYPDGSLQEAGGIIWSDGSGWNFGRGQDPAAPEYNYRRQVDYCSGAALLVRRRLLDEIGLLDRRFDPGYYEDTDLCFALRQRGYRVLYEPTAVVIHHEGTSYGTDDAPSAEGHSKVGIQANKVKFVEKWRDELAMQRENGEFRGLLDGRRDNPSRILVIDEWVPQRDKDAGSLRMHIMLLLLKDLGHRVSLFPRNRAGWEPYTSDLQRAGIEVLHSLDFAAMARGRPGFFDTVIISRPQPALELMPLVREHFPAAAVIYDTVDLHHVRELREARYLDSGHRRQDDASTRELEQMAAADVTVAVTEVEAEVIRNLVPTATTAIIPTIHEHVAEEQPGFETRSGLLFVGSFQHTPNLDAALFTIKHVLPRVRKSVPAQLWLVGSNPPAVLTALRSPEIIVTGYVDRVEPFLAQARVFLAPLRFGAGMKGKIGQAMAHGVPVVTTPIGAEGMGLVDGVHALIREDEAGLAEAVVRLYEDAELWTTLATNARLRAREWSPEVVRERLVALLDLAAAKRALRS